MKYLWKKMMRDLWKYKVQFISVFLMSFLGVLIYTGIEGTWLGMQSSFENYAKKTNLADIWIKGIDYSVDDLKKINELPEIEKSELISEIDVINSHHKEQQIHLMTDNNNQLSKADLISGEKFDSQSKNGIWIDKDYAKANQLATNDSISLDINGSEHTFQIKGIILSPEYINYTGNSISASPNHTIYGYAFISEHGFIDSFGQLLNNQIKIQTRNHLTNNYAQVEEKIRDALDGNYQIIANRINNSNIANFVNKTQQIKKMSLLFSTLFILLSILTMQSTMSRLIRNQVIQIGTLRSLGFSRSKISLHYSLYGFAITSVGVLLGYFLAPFSITPLLLNVQKKFYTLPSLEKENAYSSLFILLLIVISCTLVAYLTSNVIIKEMPAKTIRGQISTKKRFKNKEKKQNLFASFEIRWSIKDLNQNKMRTLIGVVGVAGCIMLLIASFGMYDSLTKSNQYLYGTQYDYSEKIMIDPLAKQIDKNDLINHFEENIDFIQESKVEIFRDATKEVCLLNIIDGTNYQHITSTEGKEIDFNQTGVVISDYLAKKLAVSIGSEIAIRNSLTGKTQTFKVDKIAEISTPQGVFLSKNTWTKASNDFIPNAILSNEKKELSQIATSPAVKEIYTLDSQLNDANYVLNSARIIVILLIIAAVLLSIIILYNLGLMSYTERSRDYATLKVLGFNHCKLRQIIIIDNVILLILGTLIGIPLGILFLSSYVRGISTNTVQYFPVLSYYTVFFALGITYVCDFVTIINLSGKLKKIDMVSSLKAPE